MQPIRALTIDLWNTLIYEPPGLDRTRLRLDNLQAALEEMGHVIDRAAMDAAHAISGQLVGETQADGRDLSAEQHVALFLAAVDEAFARDDAFTPEQRRKLVQIYGDPARVMLPAMIERAAETLARLRAVGLRLALISNTLRTPGRVLRHIMADMGLAQPFDTLIFSDEVGLAKPNPAIFQMALERLGASAEEAMHVGDDLVLDLLGAHNAGMRACIIRDERPADLLPADRWARRFMDVPDVIRDEASR